MLKTSTLTSTLTFTLSLMTVLGCSRTPVLAESIVYPADAGVLNVRDAAYGAKGDGLTDDTAAIQKALTAGLSRHRVVYLPDGTYMVSDTLKWQNPANAGNDVQGWGPFLQMQGQSRAKTIIRLKAGAPGFGDVETPKAVVATGSSGSHGGKKYKGGEGNEAFENHLRNFSVETGQGNAGAVGIDYQASNVGAMRHVSVRGEGFCGIALTRRDNGPGLIKDVSVEGFDFGIRIFQEIAHFTLEDVDLKGQREAGIWMRDAIIGARHIRSQNTVPAIQMAGVSLLALFDSDFSGGAGAAAITAQGTEPRLYVRGLKTTGYGGALRLRGKVEEKNLTEWSSDAPLGNSGGKLSLNLPIRETPEFWESDPTKWADVGAPNGTDDTAAIQKALNAGKSTVFFRQGNYTVKNAVLVPSGVRLITSVGAQINASGLAPGQPMFRFAGGKAGDLTIVDRFAVGGKTEAVFEAADARTLVLRDIIPFVEGGVYRDAVGGATLFIENASGIGYHFKPDTQVWARQWNLEGHGNPKMVNDGATIWTLGNKHESAETIWENKNGGRLEAWAGLAYTFGAEPNMPAAINTDASLVLQMAGMTYSGANGYFDLLVKDTQKGVTTETRRAQLVTRGPAVTIPLYVSIAPNIKPLVSVNTNNQSQGDKMNVKTSVKKLATTTIAVAAISVAIATPQSAKAAPDSASSTQSKATQSAIRTYKLPEFFDGEEKGKPTGNPLEMGGKAMWTAAQIWPDDIFKREDYKLMNWAGDAWRGAYEFGGQPGIKVTGGKVEVTSRGAWGGDGTQSGNKRAALIFTAPAKGIYKVSGTARAYVWEGDKVAGANLTLLKHDPKDGKITRVKQIATPGETEVAIEDAEVELDAGGELIFLNAVNSMYTASATSLSDLKIEFTPDAGVAPLTAVKVGQVVEVSDKSYKIVKIEGKLITLELQ